MIAQAAQVIDITPAQKEAQKALTIKEQASGLTITDKPTYDRAAELLLTIKDLRKEIESTFKPIREKAHSAWKETIVQQSKVESPLIEAEGIIKPRMAAFLAEAERIRRAEEDRLRKIAEQESAERQLAEALAAEAVGDLEEAEAILDETPAFIPPPIVARTVTTGGGISMKKNWQFRVVDATKVPREYLMVDMVKLGGVARSMKDSIKIPGVEIYAVDTIAAGRRG